MKVLLVDPVGFSTGPNIGLAYVAAVLKRKGHDVKVVDLNNHRQDIHRRLLKYSKWKPDVIGVSFFSSFTVGSTMKTVDFLKSFRNAGICFGRGSLGAYRTSAA